MKDFLKQCLVKDPRKRPSSADLLKHKFLTKVASNKEIALLSAKAKEMKKAAANNFLK